MAQWVKACADSLMTWVLATEFMWQKKRSKSCKLVSDLYMCNIKPYKQINVKSVIELNPGYNNILYLLLQCTRDISPCREPRYFQVYIAQHSLSVPSFSTTTFPITGDLDMKTFPPLQTMPYGWSLAYSFSMHIKISWRKTILEGTDSESNIITFLRAF